MPSSTSTSSSTARNLFVALLAVAAVVAAVVIFAPAPEEVKGKSQGKVASSESGTVAATSKAGQVVVEDADDDDDEEEEEEEGEDEEYDEFAAEKKRLAEEATEKLKEDFYNFLSVADKSVKGNSHARAAENYSKALELAPLVPGVGAKTMISMYNNRSAMYEKLGEFDKSMTDIDIVLAMEPKHIKARARRSRVLEARGGLEESMAELVCLSLMERHMASESQTAPLNVAAYEARTSELAKLVALKQSVKAQADIRNSKTREVPTAAYCRAYFDLLPSTHLWRTSLSAKIGMDELTARLKSAVGSAEGNKEGNDNNASYESAKVADFEAALDVTCCAIADGKFRLAFKALASAAAKGDETACASSASSSRLKFLLGTEEHLRRNLTKARELFEAASGELFDAKLTLADVLRELSEESKSEELYHSMLCSIASRLEIAGDGSQRSEDCDSQFSQFLKESAKGGASTVGCADVAREFAQAETQLSLDAAWVLLHRQSHWLVRDEKGNYRANCLVLAQQDLTFAASLLEPILSLTASAETVDVSAKSSATMATVQHLVKQVSLITHSKPQVTASHHIDDEEKERCRECVKRAKEIAPKHESVLQLETEVLAMDEKVDEAIAVADKLIGVADVSDVVPMVIRANFVAHKVSHCECSRRNAHGYVAVTFVSSL